MIKRIGLVLCAMVLGMLVLTGCGPSQGDLARATQNGYIAAAGSSPMPAEISSAVDKLTSMIKDQGVLNVWMANCKAHGINPGLQISQSITHSTKIGLDGFTGSFEAEAKGGGTQLPADFRNALLDQLKVLGDKSDPASNALRQMIYDMLSWNRTHPQTGP